MYVHASARTLKLSSIVGFPLRAIAWVTGTLNDTDMLSFIFKRVRSRTLYDVVDDLPAAKA